MTLSNRVIQDIIKLEEKLSRTNDRKEKKEIQENIKKLNQYLIEVSVLECSFEDQEVILN